MRWSRLMPLFLVTVFCLVWTVGVGVVGVWPTPAAAQKGETPHGQDRPPGPALKPEEAIKKMVVPEGFSVELVASEPDIVNPVAMTFDERGRIWITESLEYPRSSAGPGKDRIKVLESTRGDGKYDKVTIFATGLNIPSGIAVGHGGVWVANSPDILFYKEGQDGKALGKPEVVVTGFGRDDTHELPNSLTWGPDGWLYGLNGVFNWSHIKHQGKEFHFTCALFRIHPRTREFQLFAEGTSNPWGVAWDLEGSAFVSACVIDHLWHLTETGYYQRQGGAYPPFVWKLGSIVKHRHQKAAYCGIHFFDSDAYPPQYRERLYMGNIHGGCINVDVLHRDGSTYAATPAPDFLTANDAWFMPVSQKTGPDGCLYILDWYDRYHCYQDARRDPDGIDRLNGRLYRVRFKDTPRAGAFDLGKDSDEQLVQRLHSPNVFYRDLAQRLLIERGTPEVRNRLEKLIRDKDAPRKARMHGLWSLISMGPLPAELHAWLLAHKDSSYRAWAVRAAGNAGKVEPGLRSKIEELAQDASADVQLQVAIASRKLVGVNAIALLTRLLSNCGDDKLIPGIVWQNLHPLLEDQAAVFVHLAAEGDLGKTPNLVRIMPRVVERILGRKKADPQLVAGLLTLLLSNPNFDSGIVRQCLETLAVKIQTGEVPADQLASLGDKLLPILRPLMEKKASPLFLEAGLLSATLKDPAGLEVARQALAAGTGEPQRLRALDALMWARDPGLLKAVAGLLKDPRNGSEAFRGQVLTALGRLDEPGVAPVVLEAYGKLEPNLQPRAIELLTQRAAWGKQLLQTMAKKTIPASTLNVNQVRRLLAAKDPEVAKMVRELWGTVREDRNPERERTVNEMRNFLNKNKGDVKAGMVVFKNVCAQCHKIYGEGQDVGPDITVNGRSSFDQLLSNVFDPSLVIGASYQATNVTTTKGRLLTGLLVEDSPQRVILKMQGGKQETIPRGDIEEINISKVSMMPENLEKQIKPQEIADLFAYLCLDKPPSDPAARKIPGSPR
jgi:putative heme-binding domain-containing protein